jgi:hypothetical protein
MKKQQPVSNSRRAFMRDAVSAGAGAAVATLAPGAAAAEPADRAGGAEQTPKGYRLSQHVLDYYKTTTL